MNRGWESAETVKYSSLYSNRWMVVHSKFNRNVGLKTSNKKEISLKLQMAKVRMKKFEITKPSSMKASCHFLFDFMFCRVAFFVLR